MEDITIPVIIFFGFMFSILWLSIKRSNKEEKKPLSGELRNHYFIKTILDINDTIKNLKEENGIKLFLEKQVGTGDSKPITESTPYSDYIKESMVGIAFGMVGALLTPGSHEMSKKIEGIEDIQFVWSYYLFSKISNDNMSKEEKKKIQNDIREKLNILLNAKVLSLTNQTDIKKAWMTIIKDKILTPMNFAKLREEVRQTFLSELKPFKNTFSKLKLEPKKPKVEVDTIEINFCPKCGSKLIPESSFCSKCGYKIK